MDYIKVCGLKEIDHIKLCIEGGATAIGFIFNVPLSPRNLQKNQLVELIEQIPNRIKTVITFKAETFNEVKFIIKEIDADLYQVHCDFDIRELYKLPNDMKKKIIIALRLDASNKDSIIQEINHGHNQFYAYLLDNSEGHGTKFDYETFLDVLQRSFGKKIIIAGGINFENVEDYIKTLKPFGIDVSSSLESEKGVKDPIKIKRFLEKINKIKSGQ